MLKRLSIQNYALIEELEIPFSKGMTIITGETGAGKSILLGALSMLIGNRADTASLLRKNKKCIIEGTFEIGEYHLQDFFTQNDLDYENQTIIRRELSPEGKSRAFINDTPANLNILKELGTRLIEIHSQHETLTLNDSGFQMMVLDSYAGNEKKLTEFSTLLHQYNKASVNLKTLREREAQSKKDSDYFQFLFSELNDANLVENEKEKLESELELLNNSDEIKSVFSSVQAALNGDENNLVSTITALGHSMQGILRAFPRAEELVSRLKSLSIEVRDIADEVDMLERDIVSDPARAEVISDRLDIIYKLEHKHRVNSVAELLSVKADLDSKLSGITFLEEEIIKLEKSIEEARIRLVGLGADLHGSRANVIPEIEATIGKMLAELGMKHAGVKIELNALPANQFKASGTDAVRFLFSANKGVEFRELNKVASGGELSRLMLCIKSMIARLTGLPTIIFDEIDTGISGEVAHKVGNIVKEMSAERQVIAITHLPQMAGKGDEHLYVFKHMDAAQTTTSIRKLNKPERVEEIAKMLSGEQPTKAAIANARELLAGS